MRRGDVIVVSAAGDYGKPRPAIVIQSDVFPDDYPLVIVCPMTSELRNAPDFRVTIEPSTGNGLHGRSQVMADKPVTVRRERIGKRIGRLHDEDVTRISRALAFVIGLAG